MNVFPFESTDIRMLNERLCAGLDKVISEDEARIEREVEKTAEEIFRHGEKLKIVLVSGRSASGKTTFTKKVCEKLSEMGREARRVSLDDFLLGFRYMPKNDDGTFDMEHIAGLDVALANECFRKLLSGGKADFPTFDFPKQRRGDIWNRVEIGEKGLIMIEGIHALNPALTENLPEEGVLRVFIEPKTGYCIDGKNVFTPEEVRLIRRMTRDELFRGWCVEKTFAQWKSVLAGEKIYIEPYIDSAGIKVNSSVCFEPAVFAKVLPEMLLKIDEKSPFSGEAKSVFERLSLFYKIEKDFLPKDSLLREFVG